MAKIASSTSAPAGVNAPTRRRLVGGSLLAAACGAAFAGAVALPDRGETFPAKGIREMRIPSQAGPDAELVRLCAECDALQQQIDDLFDEGSDLRPHAEQLALEHDRDQLVEPLCRQQDPLLERICELRATTPQGHSARARTLLGWDKDPCWTHDECWNSQLIGAIVRDLVGAA